MTTTAERILDVTFSLACTQAANPKEKDGVGFNNADFPVGLTLAHTQAVAECAALLWLYPSQVEGYGITRDDLKPFMPEAEPTTATVRATLQASRAANAGKLGWAETETGVVFNGVRLSNETIKALKAAGGVRTTTGYAVDAKHVQAVVKVLGSSILNVHGLDAMIAMTPQVTPTAMKPKIEITMTLKGLSLGWNWSSAPAMNIIKDVVKGAGARFDGGTKLWTLKSTQALSVVAVTLLDMDLQTVNMDVLVPFAEAPTAAVLELRDEIAADALVVKAVEDNHGMVELTIRKFDADFVAAAKAVRGRYNPETNGWAIKTADVLDFVTALAKFTRFDFSKIEHLLPNAAQVETMVVAAAAAKSALPTVTPTGKTMYAHQTDDVEFLVKHTRVAKGISKLLANDMGTGKAQPLTTPVLTPLGWVQMGDLHVGDTVVGSNGLPTAVTGVFPQGKRSIYRITMSDGSSTLCCAEHLWAVQSTNHRARKGQFLVKSTEELIGDLTYGSFGNAKWYIPMVMPVAFEEKELPLHPYVLGALLGDGCISGGDQLSPSFTSVDSFILEKLSSLLPAGVSLKSKQGTSIDFYITRSCHKTHRSNPVTTALRGLGLLGRNSHTKFIPEAYKLASVEQRVALLQGLMDTDGSTSKHCLEFTTCSKALAQDFVELVQSLGGTAEVQTKNTTCPYKGVVALGLAYRINPVLPNEVLAFSLPRKAEAVITRTKYFPSRAIKSIVFEGEMEAQCIAVAAEDRLYVTESFIVTHNTLSSLVAADHAFPGGRFLLVVPAVVKGNWRREIKMFIGENESIQVVTGKSQVIDPTCRWTILNYDLLTAYAEVLMAAHYDVAILDEAHNIKTYRSQRTGALIETFDAQAQAMKSGILTGIANIWCLTGTPILNRVKELFTICRAIGHILGKSKNKFEEKYCGGHYQQVSKDKSVWVANGATNMAELTAMMAPVYRKVMKADVLNLPAKTRLQLDVDMTPAQARQYNTLAHALKIAVEESEGPESGAVLQAITRLKIETARLKTVHTIAQAEEILKTGEKVVVFTEYTEVLEQIVAHFGSQAVFINGTVTGEARDAAVDAFQTNPDVRVMVGNIKAAGVGITLVAACFVLFNDRPWVPGLIDQAEDRTNRIGQTKPVTAYHMTLAGTFDDELIDTLAEKLETINNWEKMVDGESKLAKANSEVSNFKSYLDRKAK